MSLQPNEMRILQEYPLRALLPDESGIGKLRVRRLTDDLLGQVPIEWMRNPSIFGRRKAHLIGLLSRKGELLAPLYEPGADRIDHRIREGWYPRVRIGELLEPLTDGQLAALGHIGVVTYPVDGPAWVNVYPVKPGFNVTAWVNERRRIAEKLVAETLELLFSTTPVGPDEALNVGDAFLFSAVEHGIPESLRCHLDRTHCDRVVLLGADSRAASCWMVPPKGWEDRPIKPWWPSSFLSIPERVDLLDGQGSPLARIYRDHATFLRYKGLCKSIIDIDGAADSLPSTILGLPTIDEVRWIKGVNLTFPCASFEILDGSSGAREHVYLAPIPTGHTFRTWFDSLAG